MFAGDFGVKTLLRYLFGAAPAPANDLDTIVAGFLGRREAFSDSSRLYHDLGIYGDDACEMLEEVREKFGVDFTGFDFSRYFPNETDGSILPLFKMFGYKGRRFTGFPVGHLRAVAASGRWFEPELQSSATPADAMSAKPRI